MRLSAIVVSTPADAEPSRFNGVWPPSPLSVQDREFRRPTTGLSTTSELQRSYCITRRMPPLMRARRCGGPHHKGALHAVAQDFEGHGLTPHEPHDLGLRDDVLDVASEVERAISGQLSLVRLDFRRRQVSLVRPVEFRQGSTEMMFDQPYVEEVSRELATALRLVNEVLVEQRETPIGLSIEGHTSGPHNGERTMETAKARAVKIEGMVRKHLVHWLDESSIQSSTSPPPPTPSAPPKSSFSGSAVTSAPAPPVPPVLVWGFSLSDLIVARGMSSLRPLPGTCNDELASPDAENDLPPERRMERNDRVEMRLIDMPLMVVLKAKEEVKAAVKAAAEAAAEAAAVALLTPEAILEKQKPTRTPGVRRDRDSRVSTENMASDPPAAPATARVVGEGGEESAPAATQPDGSPGSEEYGTGKAPTADALDGAMMPGSDVGMSFSRRSGKPTKGLEERAALLGRLFVHVRGKTLPVLVGEGHQTAYWLGLTAVQRYLRLPDSYTTPFSMELTPQRVLAREPPLALLPGMGSRPTTPAERWRWLKNGQRLCDCGLRDGDHVFVDVGDGVGEALSKVFVPSSRPFSAKPALVTRDERVGEAVVRFERVHISVGSDPMAITGEECLLDKTDQLPDVRPTVRYSLIDRLPSARLVADYGTWLARRKGEGPNGAADPAAITSDESFEDFKSVFERVSVVDMPKSGEWVSDVRAILWSRYDLLIYCFYSHGGAKDAPGQPPPNPKDKNSRHGQITMLDCWDFVRACGLTSPTLGINELDVQMPDHELRRKKRLELIHLPESRVSLPEFVEMLVRVALYNQPDILKPLREVKDALKDILEQHVSPVYESPIPSSCLGNAGVSPFTPLDPATRRMLRMHAISLRMLFEQHVRDDVTGYAIRVREVDNLFRESGMYRASTSDEMLTPKQLVSLFGSMVLGGHSEPALAAWMQRHAPLFPHLPAPTLDGTGRLTVLPGGGLLQWEFEELIARAALLRYAADTVTPDHMKVNELCQMLRARARPKVGRLRGSVPWLAAPPMEYTYDNGPTGGNGARLTLPRPIDEAKANAERVKAVSSLLKVRQPPPKAAAKDDKGGGKKKK